MNTNAVATAIFNRLVDKGAGIGNASIGIIEAVLNDWVPTNSKISRIHGDDPAFPFWGPGGGYGDAVVLERNGSKEILDFKPGLTKREYFAAKALQGLLARGGAQKVGVTDLLALDIADDLIKTLNL